MSDVFIYEGFDLDAATGVLECRYRTEPGDSFVERFDLGLADGWESQAAQRAARLVWLLAGISYFKTTAPSLIDLGPAALSEQEADFFSDFYRLGLGEFAVRNGRPLVEVEFLGKIDAIHEPIDVGGTDTQPLIPFGGGIDSIVSVERARAAGTTPTLFAVGRPGDLFEAIVTASEATGLELLRVGRTIDAKLLESAERGYLNGHVPITGVLSAVAVLTAVGHGRTDVIMSNEWSASFGNLEVEGVSINHQYSKSYEFEAAFRRVLAEHFGNSVNYFSMLRSDSELRIAEEFAGLTQYHSKFRSCNRAFHLRSEDRLDHWCGVCDKCAFIDLILSPFLTNEALESIFTAGAEPLQNDDLASVFLSLVGIGDDDKPFECVGEFNECVAAVHLAAGREDRVGQPLLAALAEAAAVVSPELSVEELRQPLGPNFVPDRYGNYLV